MILRSLIVSSVIFFSFYTTIVAQDFYGYVKKADSTSSPVFQAKIEIFEGDKPFNILKTYFDGSFKFTPNKSQTYRIKVSYNGYLDTAYTFTTDKKGVLSVQNVTVRLKKDGMRLLGVIRNNEEKFPINEATIILKNVMTREEKRITTGISGAYNFKLEYETNYRLTIDKRSAGIINKYIDTTFYISTVGFNLPLDYKLDIYLDPMENGTTTPREGYDPTKQPENKNLKPVIAIGENRSDSNTPAQNNPDIHEDKQPFKEQDSKLKGAQDTINKLKQELAKIQRELEEKRRKSEAKAKKTVDGTTVVKDNSTKLKGKGQSNLEVEVIPDIHVKPVYDNKGKTKGIYEFEATGTKTQEKQKTEAKKMDSLSQKISDTLKTKDHKGTNSFIPEKSMIDSVAQTSKTPKQNPDQKLITDKNTVKDPMTAIPSNLQIEKSDSVNEKTGELKNIALQKEKTYLPKSQEELVAAAEAFARQKKMLQDSLAEKKRIANQPKGEKQIIEDKR